MDTAFRRVSAIVIVTVSIWISWSGRVGAEPSGVEVSSFSTNVRVNSGGTPYAWQVEPTMVAADNGRIQVGWKEANSAEGGGQKVAHSYSSNGGTTWSPSLLMATDNLNAQASDPWLIKDGQGRIHFTRLEYDSGGTISGITTSTTTDGVSWGPANYMDDLPNFADKETVTADANGVLYMTYNSNTVLNDLVFRKSFDGGATWTPRVRVPAAAGGVIGGYIALDQTNRIYIAWSNFVAGNIMIDTSTDGGATWGTDIQVNEIPGSINDPLNAQWNISLPAIAIDQSDNVYVIWTDYRTVNSFGDIYVSRSRDHGATWDASVKVNDDTGPAGQRMADITIDGNGVLHAAWYDHRNGGYDVYYSSSSDGGQSWTPNLRVTTATTSASYRRPGDYITIRTSPINNDVYVVWTDGRDADFNIYFASNTGPSRWQTITTNPPGLLILIDGDVYVAPQIRSWMDGELHEIGTFGTQAIAFGARYSFLDWSDGGQITHTVNVSGSQIFTAGFALQFTLSVNSTYSTVTGGGWYDSGAVVAACVESAMVQESADTRHRFVGWGDDATGTSLCSDPIVMDSPKNATAMWKTQYLVTATSPYGTITGDGWHDENNWTTLVLSTGMVQVSSGERALFENWYGDASGTSTTSNQIVVDTPKTATANWTAEYLLTVLSAHGTPQGGGWFRSGFTAHISVDEFVAGATGARYVFSGWTGAITSSQRLADVLMETPATVTAEWTTEYRVDVLSDHGNVSGTGWYAAGSIATIIAPLSVTDANGTWNFLNWSGDFTSDRNFTSVVVDGAKVIRANWMKAPGGRTSDVLAGYFWVILVSIVVVLMLVILLAFKRRRKEEEQDLPSNTEEKRAPR